MKQKHRLRASETFDGIWCMDDVVDAWCRSITYFNDPTNADFPVQPSYGIPEDLGVDDRNDSWFFYRRQNRISSDKILG